MATSIYSNDETLKILYMIPSISIYPPDQIYIYVESEREYDLLAIAKIGNSIVPIMFELASGRFEEADKLVREARLWPYPLIWVLLEGGGQGIRIPATLGPRVIREEDLLSLIDRELTCYIEKIWGILPSLLNCDKGQTTIRDRESSIVEMAKGLFALRWLIYSIGAEIPVYLYFSYLYLSKASLCGSIDSDPCSVSSPWDWVSKSIKNTFSLIVDGSKSDGQIYPLNSILETYGNIFEAELELLEATINRQAMARPVDFDSIIHKIMGSHIRLLDILYNELKHTACPPDKGQQRTCQGLCGDSSSGSDTDKHLPRIYPRELIEVSRGENLRLLVLPQRPKRRKYIEDIIGKSLGDDDSCGDQRKAMHSCTLKYIVGGRLCEFLNLVRDLKQTCDLSKAIEKIKIVALEWDRERECREAEEDLGGLVSRDIYNMEIYCDRRVEMPSRILEGIIDDPGRDVSVVILIISDYKKEIIRDILSEICRYGSSLKAKIWIAISPITIYARGSKLENLFSSSSTSLSKILDVCFLRADKMGCLQVEPLRIYIDKLYSPGDHGGSKQ